MYDVLPWSAQGTRKLEEKSDSPTAKKGAKKLVISGCMENLDKKVATKIRETCKKT